ncbi:MAG: Bax inhibitor-1/YccA family protein [Neomegalonema sp.]|nr:Bax inhibitor-1/YccA family protein [Neomegalonema sp.]
MVDFQPSVARSRAGVSNIDEGLRAYMGKVYMLMAVAMVITAGASYALGAVMNNDPQLVDTLFRSPLKWVLMFAPLGFALLFGAMANRVSAATAQLMFYGFAVVMGISISWIFVVFNLGSIVTTFLATSVAFLALSIYGYTTKSDLSAIGRFAMMAVIGLIVVSILNIFVQSSGLQFAISAIGVLVFAALTAYDTQQIKNTYLEAAHAGPAGAEYLEKGAIMGALSLYLDFINMFMFLLQFMGASDD